MGKTLNFAKLAAVASAFCATPALANGDSDEAFDPQAYFAAECSQCHGRAARGMASFPSLRGKTPDYLTQRLETYRAGDAVGPNSMLMYPIAEELSDTMIESLSAYISENFG